MSSKKLKYKDLKKLKRKLRREISEGNLTDEEKQAKLEELKANKPEGPFGPRGFMGMFDKDKDGKVTKEEFTGPENMFGQFDKNGDGVIEESEAPTGPPGQQMI